MNNWRMRWDAVLSDEIVYSPYLHFSPEINEGKVLVSFCEYLRRQYESMLSIVEGLDIQIDVGGNIHEIPFLDGFLEESGLPLAEVFPEKEEISSPKRRFHISEEKLALLNFAISLGCDWAIKEMDRIREFL